MPKQKLHRCTSDNAITNTPRKCKIISLDILIKTVCVLVYSQYISTHTYCLLGKIKVHMINILVFSRKLLLKFYSDKSMSFLVGRAHVYCIFLIDVLNCTSHTNIMLANIREMSHLMSLDDGHRNCLLFLMQ
jgi:hypothetical protein